VAEFQDKPDLIKVGISKNVGVRIKGLESSHGRCIALQEIFIGSTYQKKEKATHKQFAKYRVSVGGDGGTEFFSKSVKGDVLDFLNHKVSKEQKEIDYLNEKILEREEKFDRLVYKIFVSSDLSFKPKLQTWNRNPSLLLSGLLNVGIAHDLGFPLEDCLELQLSKALKNGFTTTGRVKLLYECSVNDLVLRTMRQRIRTLEKSITASKKYKKLESHFGKGDITQEMVESIISANAEGDEVALFGNIYYLRDGEAWYDHPDLRGLYKLLK
jgi:hypothetical protein